MANLTITAMPPEGEQPMNPTDTRETRPGRKSAPLPEGDRLPPAPLGNRPATTAERLLDLERMREQINENISFICQIGALRGSSTESKDKAVASFHHCMCVLERQLARILDELRLG
jgi:hypothetical protein